MLVLTRKPNEKIHIGNDITITVIRVKGQQVRLGIEAPRNVRVLRAELPVLLEHAEAAEGPLAELTLAAEHPQTEDEVDGHANVGSKSVTSVDQKLDAAV